MKPQVNKISDTKYLVKTSQGKVYEIIVHFLEVTKYTVLHISNDPKYVMVGKMLHKIPNIIKNKFFELQTIK